MSEVPTTAAVRLSQAQVLDAIRSMTAGERTKVVQIARSLAKMMLDYRLYEVLISEASVRAIDGRRMWVRGQPAVSFYFGSMRSIAHEWRKKKLTDGKADDGALASAPEEETEAEELRLHEMKSKVLRAFDDDPTAQKIVSGMMGGSRGEDLRQLSGLDPISFASKQRKVDRGLRKFMGSVRP